MATRLLRSRSSSLVSYHTANDSLVEGSTTASSPAQIVPCPYRDARQLPRVLKDHCQIFLEEQLYTCAINLMNSTLGSGISRRTPCTKPSLIPPPSHLALLNTLVIHPTHTTRAENADLREVSALALIYLRSLLTVVGPVKAGFRTAFQFHASSRWSRRSAFTSVDSDSDMSDEESDHDHNHVRGRLANQASLWCRGQDLWTTVGWAFNTSTLYPQRWQYWKVWLDFMLDVLETDWGERERQDDAAYELMGGEGDVPVAARGEAMIVMYMEQNMDRHTALKRIMKALFADGSSLSSSSFPEVFEKEPRGPKKASKKRKREQVVDLDNDNFGDYFDDDSISSGISEPPTPQKPRDGTRNDTLGSSNPGLVESIKFRLRFFQLLSAASSALDGGIELDRLYEDFAHGIKCLRLDLFALYVTQRENPLLPMVHVTIIKELFHSLIPSHHKKPHKVDPEGDARAGLTVPMLEHCYVPLPANTVALEENAKLSLLVENAVQLLWLNDEIEYSESFAAACEEGIQAREAKGKKKRTGKAGADSGDAVAHDVLIRSGERIRITMEALKMTTI
ncbi:hypothetical protein QQS21_008163 [Conoideocrella luteorostrata]|uniref:Uncharacterized protein n=1 Tax=Conoideocrella luteorostrata TaxID=1105319 RepID=A0AAJ0CLN6_9HYPO|nr:hypothetical protein QQS21_008163 [Conoideocrella luteorostrata]